MEVEARGILARVLAAGPICRSVGSAALESGLNRIHDLRATLYLAVFDLHGVYHGRSHQLVETVLMGVQPAGEGDLRDNDDEHDAEEGGQAIPRVLEGAAPAQDGDDEHEDSGAEQNVQARLVVVPFLGDRY